MGIVYDTSVGSKFEGNFNPYKYDGVQQYEKHFKNLLYLDFIAANAKSSFSEKRQAETEIVIAKRKLKYWKRIVDVQGSSQTLLSVIEKAKKQWNK